ncbi:MAG: hypothetical protein QM702_21135 [Rubrivivax sp.]
MRRGNGRSPLRARPYHAALRQQATSSGSAVSTQRFTRKSVRAHDVAHVAMKSVGSLQFLWENETIVARSTNLEIDDDVRADPLGRTVGAAPRGALPVGRVHAHERDAHALEVAEQRAFVERAKDLVARRVHREPMDDVRHVLSLLQNVMNGDGA